ncbi:hypothetical protein HPP92_025371 [Vanilla planifolia]|uniref:Protein kinase domain-containing protein n=1 Tax=Vanilla planifolia TaxID=51239 RepID=A0A835PM51_VANPL|nr:hypothetical protein HPP92_025371 [Vanilla planifolia]
MMLTLAASQSVTSRGVRDRSCRRRRTRRRKTSALRLFCSGLVSARFAQRASLITNPDDFAVKRRIGEYGVMNITSNPPFQPGVIGSDGLSLGCSSTYSERLSVQDIREDRVKIRLYEGRVVQGQLKGTPVIFKVYPGARAGGIVADMMAANELNSYADLQADLKDLCVNIQFLLGGFETRTGEQWLAFRNNGVYSAADYAKARSEGISKVLGSEKTRIWFDLNKEEKLKRRRYFIIKLLNGAITGLAFMHDHDRLHQSIGPASVVLNTISDGEARYLVPRLRDLAFSVDLRFQSLEEDCSNLSEGLWRRASAAGAHTPLEKKAFGIADDIYEAGLLFAYLAFVPFCDRGVMDVLTIRRLFESIFQLDVGAAREYCSADDRLQEAVQFLDLGDGAGWELLQAMLSRDYRRRPGAHAVLNHRFMKGEVL